MELPFKSGVLPIGIDFGASGVKLVQLRRRGDGFALLAAARIDIETSDEDLERPEHLAQLAAAVARRVESGGFSGKRCVVSIDDRMLRVRSVRQPRMSDDEADKALRLDAASRLGFAEMEPVEVGWVRVGEVRQGEDHRDEVVLVGARRQPIETLVYELAAGGLQPTAVEPGFMASARSFGRKIRRATEQGEVRVVVDLGWRMTSVIVLRGRSIGFFKPLELGGRDLTAAAAQRLGLEPGAALDVRRRRMSTAESESGVDRKVDRAMFEAVRPLVGELASEVAMCLRYFGVTFRGSRPDECLVVGGEAREPHLLELMADELRLPVSIGRPLDGVEACEGTSWLARECELSAATGLSLRPWELSVTRRGNRRGLEPRGPEAAGGPETEAASAARKEAA